MEVYVAEAAALSGYFDEGLALLAPARREKLSRLQREDDRLRGLAASLLLRRYVGGEPLYGAHGKPYLPGGPEFSLSHSGRLAVLAVHALPVGVDVERPRPWNAAVAERVLTPAERQWLSRGGEERFFFLWTRKEAVMKCTGLGLSMEAGSFSVLPGAENGFALCTRRFEEHILSVATKGGDAAFEPVPAPAEALLS